MKKCSSVREFGKNCQRPCDDGRFNPDKHCIGVCRCMDNTKCRVTDGVCIYGGCTSGWTRENCSVKCIPGYWGLDCVRRCNCHKRAPCDHVQGSCTNGCASGFEGAACDQAYDQDDFVTPTVWAGVGLLIGIVLISIIVLIIVWYRTTQRAFNSASILAALDSKYPTKGKENAKTAVEISDEMHKRERIANLRHIQQETAYARSKSKSKTEKSKKQPSGKSGKPKDRAKKAKKQRKEEKRQAKLRAKAKEQKSSQMPSSRKAPLKIFGKSPSKKPAPPQVDRRQYEQKAMQYVTQPKPQHKDSYTWVDNLSYDTLCKISKLKETKARGPPEPLQRKLFDTINRMEDNLNKQRQSQKYGPEKNRETSRAESNTTPGQSVYSESYSKSPSVKKPPVDSQSRATRSKPRTTSEATEASCAACRDKSQRSYQCEDCTAKEQAAAYPNPDVSDVAPPRQHTSTLKPNAYNQVSSYREYSRSPEAQSRSVTPSRRAPSKEPTIRVHARVGKDHYVLQRPLRQLMDTGYDSAPFTLASSTTNPAQSYNTVSTDHQSSMKQPLALPNPHEATNAVIRVSVQALKRRDEQSSRSRSPSPANEQSDYNPFEY